MEEKDEVEKKPIDIDFKWSGVQEEDGGDISLANFIENYKTYWREIFPKK